MSPDGDPLLECAGLGADQLATVLEMIGGTEITELDVTLGATRLSVRRAGRPISVAASAPPLGEPLTLAIASPLVGIFRPCVSVGDALQPGQSIGAIEALGMPTSVDAPQAGTVEDLLVGDGSPVEYGQALLTLRRSSHAP